MNKIIQGDCLELMKDIESKSIDMILCDLPYGTTACKWDSIIPLESLWSEYKRIIKPNGAIVLTASQPFTTKLISSNYEMFRYEWIWHKNHGGGFATAKFMPMKRHENVLVFYNTKPTYNPIFEEYSDSTKKRFKDGDSVNRWKQVSKSINEVYNGLSYAGEQSILLDRGTYPTTVKYFKNPHNANGNRLHPTQKPTDLFEYLIKTYTNEGELVLDNTAGSCTTAIACLNTKRNYICMEMEQKYYEIGLKRVSDWHKINETNIFK